MAIPTARSISSFHGPTDVKTSKRWPENDAYIQTTVARRSGWKSVSIKVREFRWARDVGRA